MVAILLYRPLPLCLVSLTPQHRYGLSGCYQARSWAVGEGEAH